MVIINCYLLPTNDHHATGNGVTLQINVFLH